MMGRRATIRVEAADLHRYIKQLRKLTPRDLQKMSAAAMRTCATPCKNALRQVISDHGTSPLKRRPKLKHTVSHRIYARADRAPNTVLYVGTRAPAAPAGKINAAQRLRMLEGTVDRYTRNRAFRGRIRSRNIIRKFIRRSSAVAMTLYRHNMIPQVEKSLTPKGGKGNFQASRRAFGGR